MLAVVLFFYKQTANLRVHHLHHILTDGGKIPTGAG
jgi:hypothetical protein